MKGLETKVTIKTAPFEDYGEGLYQILDRAVEVLREEFQGNIHILLDGIYWDGEDIVSEPD